MKVVELRSGPLLNDSPGMLRKLADDIEAGAHGEVQAALVLIPRDNDFPLAFGFGNLDGERHPIVTLQLATHWFCNNLVER